jgi:hypothetical protein
MKSKHFPAVKVHGAKVVFRSNGENGVILLTSHPSRRSGSAKRFGIWRDNSPVGGGGCTDVWRLHNFETLRKTAEHTYALFLLVGINLDCQAPSPRIGIETNLKSPVYYGGGGRKKRRNFFKKLIGKNVLVRSIPEQDSGLFGDEPRAGDGVAQKSCSAISAVRGSHQV